jgi:uncharacterized SAM-binding protein YcdF (DUF218 family)
MALSKPVSEVFIGSGHAPFSLVMSRKALFSLLSIVALLPLIVVLIVNVRIARSTSARDACIANLKQIDAAKAKWELQSSVIAPSTNRTLDNIQNSP